MQNIGLDLSVIEQTTGNSILQAILIIAMLSFLIWNIKLALENID